MGSVRILFLENHNGRYNMSFHLSGKTFGGSVLLSQILILFSSPIFIYRILFFRKYQCWTRTLGYKYQAKTTKYFINDLYKHLNSNPEQKLNRKFCTILKQFYPHWLSSTAFFSPPKNIINIKVFSLYFNSYYKGLLN